MPSTTSTKTRRSAAPVIDLPDEVVTLLQAAGRTAADVVVEVDGEMRLDENAVEDLRTQVEEAAAEARIQAIDDEADLAANEALEDEDEDVTVDVSDDREVEDFDFDAIIADLDLPDVDGCLALFEELRPAYTRAARRAGKKNPAADFFNVVNAPLFNRRKALQLQVAELDAVDAAQRSGADERHARRLRRQLETLTELIVRFNYGMTRKYVRLFTSNTSREDSDDFQGAAVLGLMNSIDTFDPARGKFGSWAYKRIQREVLRAVRDADFKSMNHGDFERRPDILRAYAKLAGPNDERTPSFEEVAAEVGCTLDLVKRVLAAPHLDSLHTQVGQDGETELGDLIPDTTQAIDDQVIGAMDVAALTEFGLSVLDTREHFVLARRYGLDGEPVQCLSSIGKQLRLSREAVRQIEAKALSRLLHPVTLARVVRHGR